MYMTVTMIQIPPNQSVYYMLMDEFDIDWHRRRAWIDTPFLRQIKDILNNELEGGTL